MIFSQGFKKIWLFFDVCIWNSEDSDQLYLLSVEEVKYKQGAIWISVIKSRIRHHFGIY